MFSSIFFLYQKHAYYLEKTSCGVECGWTQTKKYFSQVTIAVITAVVVSACVVISSIYDTTFHNVPNKSPEHGHISFLLKYKNRVKLKFSSPSKHLMFMLLPSIKLIEFNFDQSTLHGFAIEIAMKFKNKIHVNFLNLIFQTFFNLSNK